MFPDDPDVDGLCAVLRQRGQTGLEVYAGDSCEHESPRDYTPGVVSAINAISHVRVEPPWRLEFIVSRYSSTVEISAPTLLAEVSRVRQDLR